jgi:hypothetical protein
MEIGRGWMDGRLLWALTSSDFLESFSFPNACLKIYILGRVFEIFFHAFQKSNMWKPHVCSNVLYFYTHSDYLLLLI